jgi:integrase
LLTPPPPPPLPLPSRSNHRNANRLSSNGALEFLHDHADTDGDSGKKKMRERILQLPAHPLSHIILSVEAVGRSDNTKKRTFTVVVLASGVVPRMQGEDELLLRSSVAASLRHGISVCQKTLSAMQHVLLSVAAAQSFHAFRHSKLTYLLQHPLTSSDVVVLLLGVPTALAEQERSAHLLNVGKRVVKNASKARVNNLLVSGQHARRGRIRGMKASAWR